ncbi:cache domain-containing sensor histidine kinase [Peribacillus sp. SCS-26]|uniref:cache domain-containing sensor histidine kinase n=1 Tax=Paraperibacillus marinus TaxID=3115295 RepID=UPI0039058F5F
MFFSLRNRLFIIFTCLLTIPFILLSLIIPRWFTSIIEEQAVNLTVEAMDQYMLYTDAIITQAEDLGKQVLVNQTTQDWLKIEKEYASVPEGKRRVMTNELKMLLSSMMINNSNGISISIFLNDGTGTWGRDPHLKNREWFTNFKEYKNPLVTSHIDTFQQSLAMSERKVNSYILPLFDTNTFKLYGVIKVNFPSSLLEEGLKNITIGKHGRTNLVDGRGRNVLPGKQHTPENVLKNSMAKIKAKERPKGYIRTAYRGEDYLIFYQKLGVGDWTLISEVTESDLFSKVQKLQNNLLALSGIVFLLTIVSSFLLSSTIAGPLGRLADAMKFIERGDFAGAKRMMPAIKSFNNETGYLVRVVSHTIDRLRSLIETEYETNLRRKDAEYKALLLQINPHFLNNTLEMIGGLAVQGKNKEVMDTTVYLGRMMRYSLDTRKITVTLGEEMDYIKSYTNLLSVRYAGTLSITIQEDKEARGLSIIKFILQPLVENAVKYSFTESKHAEVIIKTFKTSHSVQITIEDKGSGMPQDVIDHLLREEIEDKPHHVLTSRGSSIGLRNVLGRLKLFYGSRFSYDIVSEIRKGTRITLCIHLEEGDIHDERINYG